MASEVGLSRRERQIMDILYERGPASVAEVLEALPDPPSYSSVRALLGVLVEKGHARHRKEGRGYVYLPTQPRRVEGQSALKRVLRTFFGGNVEHAVAALVSDTELSLSDEELERLSALIDQAKGDRK